MRIAVIVTGGTISSAGAPLTPLPAPEFAAACQAVLGPTLAARLPGTTIDYVADLAFPHAPAGALDSTNLTPEDWCIVAERIVQGYRSYDAWVILHGTDTLQYTSAALAFLLNRFDATGRPVAVLDKPVVVTGSQLPLLTQTADDEFVLREDSDAMPNLLAALDAATHGNLGVTVAFGGSLMDGTRVVKTSTVDFEGFMSPNAPALKTPVLEAHVDATPVLADPDHLEGIGLRSGAVLKTMRARLHHIRTTITHRLVLTVAAFPTVGSPRTMDSFLASTIKLAVSEGAHGLILESYGNGNFPSGRPSDPLKGSIAQAVAHAVDSGVVCVNVSQVLRGGLAGSTYLAGSWMADLGVLSGGDMTPSAALAKLTVLCAEVGWEGTDWGDCTVSTLMGMSLIGETTALA
ncbi:asparaginase domain-containing protein [Demequina salsinemoris]|uniref:asparaginase domain-containing protein n=1 Tax=Demequina salsinemoris TaxID=577470 RepID=UPI000781C9F7|nr:asparaginase domain-containing protein [Demequina salsinemoris]